MDQKKAEWRLVNKNVFLYFRETTHKLLKFVVDREYYHTTTRNLKPQPHSRLQPRHSKEKRTEKKWINLTSNDRLHHNT